jgi:ribosome-associated translation inhibitor RaiA
MELIDTLRAHVERRLQHTLGRFGPYILRVTVLLVDLNGPHGGRDKQCRIAVALSQAGHLHVEVSDADLYTAIERAADRIGQVVTRDLQHWGDPSLRTTATRVSAATLFRRTPRDQAWTWQQVAA